MDNDACTRQVDIMKKDEKRKLFEQEVRKRMEPPFFMERREAEILVAILLWEHNNGS